MKQLNSQHLTRIGSFAAAGCILFAASISSSGCSDSESRMTGVGLGDANSSTRSSAWSLEDLPASLDLTAEQSVEMENAIAQLNTESQASHGKSWRARGTDARTRGIHESPMLDFLESSSQTLRTDQFLILCDHLASQRAERHHEWIERRKRHRAHEKADRSTISTPDRRTDRKEPRTGRMHDAIDRRLETLEARMTRREEFLAGVLMLAPDQARRVEQILSASIPERRSHLEGLRDGTSGWKAAALQGVELERRVLAEVSSTLNEDQLKRFDAIRDLVPLGTTALGGRGRMHF